MAGRVITIAQQKGGAGKTTLAVNLGLTAAEFGLRVALVDIDPQGSLTRWFALRRAALGGAAGIELSTVTGWRAANEIDRLAREYDLVVVDSPPHAQTDAKTVIRAPHLVVVPVQPSPLDIWATKPTIDLAEAERKHPVLVLNRVPSRSPIAEEDGGGRGRAGRRAGPGQARQPRQLRRGHGARPRRARGIARHDRRARNGQAHARAPRHGRQLSLSAPPRPARRSGAGTPDRPWPGSA
ncbi:MAG: ParA family protein [Aliidongia sp.]